MQTKPKCGNCVFAEVAAKEGESYTFLNPFGEEVTRVYQQTVLLCRAMPPIAGQWPQVTVDDWCGHFDTGEEKGQP